MPRFRPGEVKYVTNTTGAALAHGAPVKIGALVGVSIKQVAPDPTTALATQKLIATSEKFLLKHKRVVEVPAVGGLNDNDLVYITSGNALSATASGNTAFGRVADLPGTRGLPSTLMRVDLDFKT